MGATPSWAKLTCYLLVTVMVRYASSELGMKARRQTPCDVKENSTEMTVYFNCERQGLREFPSGITMNVTTLSLAENRIEKLSGSPFHGLKNLSHLCLNWLNDNHGVNISKGIFLNLTKLKTLDMKGLGLKNVPDQLPNTLERLNLDENKIHSLNGACLSPVKNLTELNLSKNCYYWNPCFTFYQIKDDSFSGFLRLSNLSLSHNNLSTVPRGLPISLTTLKLASNRIQFIGEKDFEELINLEILHLQGNCPRCQTAPYPCVPCPNGSIEIHPQAFSSLVHLRSLSLAGNSISSISSSWFKSLSNLTSLFLSFNFLAPVIETGEFLNSLSNVQKLDVSFNYDLKAYRKTIMLSKHFSTLGSLKVLHIEGYVFQDVTGESLNPLYNLKNLSVLNLGTNFIIHINSSIFKKLQNVKLIYLSENRLAPVSLHTPVIYGTSSNFKPSLSKLPLVESYLHPKDFVYELSHILIKPECFESGRVLDLSRNNFFFIDQMWFEGHGNISCLNLSRNGFAAAPNGTEFSLLPELKYLDLSFNKIDLAYENAFKELQKLEILDLSFNAHYFTVYGVTMKLDFLKNLPALRVLNMSSNSISTLTSKLMISSSLKELQFQHNILGKLWHMRDTSYDNLFTNLKNLTHLNIAFNNIYKIPCRIFENLPRSLQNLQLSNNELKDFDWSMLKGFDRLEELKLDHNKLSYVSKNLSESGKSLRYLDLSHNDISQLTNEFVNGATNLLCLDLSYNKLSLINQSTFPSSADHKLEELLLHGNPFHCTCDLLEFILWIQNSTVRIPWLATRVTCSMPEQRSGKVLFNAKVFDIRECIDNNLALLLYLVSALFILCVTITAIVLHLFYWDATYLFYLLKAQLMGYQYLSSTGNDYDAFIAYDTKDPMVSDWVLNHLLVQLEGQGDRFLPVCLAERDWTPGSPVLDNLALSIRQSRKTVFVLTEAYVQSGGFKMAVYLAHQRLLDDNEDVIVLLLLEPVLQHSHFLRLRKRLCGRSVLEWPKSPSAEAWFWQCLRNTIRVDNEDAYSKMYSKYLSTK